MTAMRNMIVAACALILVSVISGCADPAKFRSDLAGLRDFGQSKAAIEASIASELSDKSTIEDGKNWFARHGISVSESKDANGDTRLFGGFYPYETQGFWASNSLRAVVIFGADGRFRKGMAEVSQSCL